MNKFDQIVSSMGGASLEPTRKRGERQAIASDRSGRQAQEVENAVWRLLEQLEKSTPYREGRTRYQEAILAGEETQAHAARIALDKMLTEKPFRIGYFEKLALLNHLRDTALTSPGVPAVAEAAPQTVPVETETQPATPSTVVRRRKPAVAVEEPDMPHDPATPRLSSYLESNLALGASIRTFNRTYGLASRDTREVMKTTMHAQLVEAGATLGAPASHADVLLAAIVHGAEQDSYGHRAATPLRARASR